MLRLLVTARWLGWTLLAVAAVVVCGTMSYWQVLRAESLTGSLLNVGYALQWPLFGLFFAALWWRMLRAEARALDEALDEARSLHGGAAAAVSAGPASSAPGSSAPASSVSSAPSPFTPRPRGVAAGADQGDPLPGSARAEYNALLADLARREESAATGSREP